MVAGNAGQWQENIQDIAQTNDTLATNSGAKADAAVTDPSLSASEIALLKGILTILAQGANAGAAGNVSAALGGFVDGAIATIGQKADAAWSGSGSGSEIAILKKIVALLAAALPLPIGASTETTLAAAKSDLDSIVTQTLTPNVSDRWARQVGQVDIARVLGAAMSATNPVPVQDFIMSATLAGKVFSASFEGMATGNGWRPLSIFNPSNSGKTGVFYSGKGFFNYGNGTTQIFSVTSDPLYSTPAAISNHDRSSNNTSVFNATVSTSVVSPPDYQTRLDYSPYTSEADEGISNRTVYKIGPGEGITIWVYGTDAQEYGFLVKWAEY